MHPDNEPISLGAGTLYIIDQETGEEAPLGQVTQIRGIEADTSGAYSYNGVQLPPLPEADVHRIKQPPTATFTFTIRSKRMTRKKFVKKLMADGVPRNIANDMADLVLIHGHTYAWGYFVICVSGVLPWKGD